MNEDSNYFNLSHPQKRIWYSEQLQPGTGMWNNAGTIKITGEVSFPLLEEAVNLVVEHCDTLRTRIEVSKDETLQYIEPYSYIPLEIIDFTNKSLDEVYEWDRQQSAIPIEYINSNLFYFAMLRFDTASCGLYLKVDHIISDAWSLVMLVNSITETYDNLLLGNEVNLSGMLSYNEYIKAEQQYLTSKRFQSDSNYLKNKYEVVPELLGLRTRYDSQKVNTAKRRSYLSSGEVVKQISEYCRGNRISVFSFALSLLSIYLYRATGKTDFVIGTSILNRVNEDEKNTFGMFVSTVPIRVKIDPDMGFDELNREIAEEIMSCLRHQKYPYNLLMEEIRNKNNEIDNLFDVTLSFQNASFTKQTRGFRYEVRWHYPASQVNSLDIHINDREGEDIYVWDYNYLSSLFNDTDIDQMHEYLSSLTEEVLQNQDIKLRDIRMMSEAQQQQLIDDLKGETGRWNEPSTLIGLFEDRVKRTPDEAAFVSEGITYTPRQLEYKANAIAQLLLGKGAKAEEVVVIMMDKTLTLMTSILGVLKSSAAFLPIDPSTPLERVLAIYKKCSAKLAIVDLEFKEYFDDDVTVFTTDFIKTLEDVETPPNVTRDPYSLAYVIFTSGTTGEPKGVMIENRSVAKFCMDFSDLMDVTNRMTTLSLCTISFDLFILEVFPALACGALLVMATNDEAKFPESITKLIKDNNVNSVKCTPSRMSIILGQCPDDILRDFKQIMLGAEPLPLSLVKKLRERTNSQIFNFYGPTETTIGITYKEIVDDEINIGRPMQDVTAYILDDNLKLTPRGSTGQLFLGGAYLARGYIANEEETNRVFLKDPFDITKRMYKTGDIVSLSHKNEIVYHERSDSQVKIRGFRVELDEIRSRLLDIDRVDNCVVVALENERNEKYLCAYICGQDTPSRNELRTALGRTLPYYMVPSHFVKIDQIPMNINGKLDRRLLPHPDKQNEDILIDERAVPPLTKTEIALADMFEQVLGVAVNDRNDNFFELGGNSLNIIAVSGLVRHYYGLEVSLRDVYMDPTLKGYAALIDRAVLGEDYIPIERTEEQKDYPASAAQRRIFMLRGIDEESIVYNMPGALKIIGEFDISKMTKALNTVISRHESLRTGIFIRNGQLRQKVYRKINAKINSYSCSSKEIPGMLRSFIKPFDIATPPLIRIEHIAVSEDENILFIDMHHIISDGISYEIIMDQLGEAYEGRELKKENLRYIDYAVWQQSYFNSTEMLKQKEFWKEHLSGELPQLTLRTDTKRKTRQQFTGKRSSFRIQSRMQSDIYRFAKSNAVTPYTVLLSAFYILLMRYTSDEDIIVGTPSAGRNKDELTDIVGMFVNTLALRAKPEATKSCRDFIKEVQSIVMDGMVNQDYPFEYLLNDLAIKRDLSRNPIFDVFFSYNTSEITFNLQNTKVNEIEIPWKFSKFDITFDIRDLHEGMIWNIEYNELYKTSTISRMASHYINILRSMIEDCSKSLSEVNMIDRNEEDLIIERLRGRYSAIDTEISPEEKILTQYEEIGEKTAVITTEGTLTYYELFERSNSLAALLIEKGVEQTDIVVVSMPRSQELLISILAVLKVGAAYLPLDPDYPKDRIEYMINDSGARFAITSRQMPKNTIVIDPYTVKKTKKKLDFITKPDDARAYLIYTSGSTGLPKGVTITRRSLLNLCEAAKNFEVIHKDDVVMSVTTISFDIFVLEGLVGLYQGATVALCNEEQQRVPSVLASFINETKGTFIQFTPSRLALMLSDRNFCRAIANISTIVIGGEALPFELVAKLKRYTKARIINGYGPTEATVYSTFKDMSDTKFVTIGKSVLNTQSYILDPYLNIVPEGVVGELYVGGVGVSPGYHQRDKLNAERFIENPFDPTDRIYKTGDLVCLMSNDDILCLGRVDDQIKLGGHRIEPGEIERVLESNSDVSKAVVVLQKVMGDMRLVAYYLSTAKEVKADSLRNFLMEKLPSYMVPNYFIRMDSFPMTSSGKVDRKSLPSPDADKADIPENKGPMTDEEKKIARIWKKVLGTSNIGPMDDFFSLGGDSMSVIRVQIELLKLGISISTQEFYEKPTIRLVVSGLDETRKSQEKASRRRYMATVPRIETKQFSLDKVLLTGATGYLGAHVLRELIKGKAKEIVLIVRGKDIKKAKERLKDVLLGYFGDDSKKILKKVSIICSDISKGIQTDGFIPDTIINCAALTSHYGTEEVFNEANVVSVKHLIDFCNIHSVNLCHISTTSVSGTVKIDAKNEKEVLFTEDDFYINQNYNENLYVKSKFEAENLIMKAAVKGLSAKIMRVGNLMPRYSDGVFQKEPERNAFMNRLKSYSATAIAPKMAIGLGGEFTPVDLTAEAIMLLISNKTPLVSHIFNPVLTKGKDIIKVLETNGKKIRIVDDEQYPKELRSIASTNSALSISGVVEDIMHPVSNGARIKVLADKTVSLLEALGFTWKTINKNYLKKALSQILD